MPRKMDSLTIPGVLCALLLSLMAPQEVAARVADPCDQKLAEVDRRIEEHSELSESEAAAILQMRDTAAQLCGQGGTAMGNQILDALLERLGEPPVESEGGAEETDLSVLTADYLEGRWCSVASTGETSPWLFHADGSHEIGVAAGQGYSMRPGGSSIDAFRQRYHRLELKESERFVVFRHSYRTEFTRGGCVRGEAGSADDVDLGRLSGLYGTTDENRNFVLLARETNDGGGHLTLIPTWGDGFSYELVPESGTRFREAGASSSGEPTVVVFSLGPDGTPAALTFEGGPFHDRGRLPRVGDVPPGWR